MTEFIKSMLAKTLDQAGVQLGDPAYVAEAKLDGQRAQIVVREHRTVACYSRIGRDLLGEKGCAWLKTIEWPVAAARLDGELYTGQGQNTAGPDVLHARSTAGEALALAVFDLLELSDAAGAIQSTMGLPWEDRRKLLETLFAGVTLPRISLSPVSADHQALWQAWVEQMGGEGIMLKHRQSKWVPGWRSPYWIKCKREMTVDVLITGVTDKPTYDNGGYRTPGKGWALTYGYIVDGRLVTVGQGIQFGPMAELEQYVGRVAEVRCNGVMPSGAVRHGRFLRWRPDKQPEDCRLEEAA